MQKGKGKAASSAAAKTPQPRLIRKTEHGDLPDDDTQDAAADSTQLQHEIDAATELLEGFNAHAATWEALEVS